MKNFIILFFMLLSISVQAQTTLELIDNDLKVTRRSGISIRYPLTDITYRIDETDSLIYFRPLSSSSIPFYVLASDLVIAGKTSSIEKMKWISDNLKGVSSSSVTIVQELATIGTVAPTTVSITTSQTLTTTDAISITIENIGGASGTITEGGVSFPLPIGIAYTYDRVLDEVSNKYSPFPTITVNGTGTTIKVTTYKRQ